MITENRLLVNRLSIVVLKNQGRPFSPRRLNFIGV